MKELIAFFKDIFMIESQDFRTGLSQFKTTQKFQKPKVTKISKEIKLSDLMKKSA